MKIITVEGQEYRLPNTPNTFQEALYIHLIRWKWAHITREPGLDRGNLYDAILPKRYAQQYPMLYPDILVAFRRHLEKFPFRIHNYFNHMVSSQAANINLFLPVLLHPEAGTILGAIKSDFARLATDDLDHGYRIEFWDEPYGNLRDKSKTTGTDTDIAIAYYNHAGERCLWLIEHKLSESEFTTCGGFKSVGRQLRHDCSQPFAAILADKNLCYYHDACHFNYWEITAANQAFFPNHIRHAHCPFQGGMNQLWRNQLLGLSIEQDARQPYQYVTFSVVKHPRNTYLDQSLANYQTIIAGNPKFFTFTSADIITAATALGNPQLERWAAWYRDLYAL